MDIMSLLITAFGLLFAMASAGPLTTQSDGPNTFLFATELFQSICKEKPEENVIISPFSINTALAMVYFAAGEKTEEELRKGLRLGESLNKQQIAESFGKLLQATKNNSATVNSANKIYVKEGNQITPSFNDVAKKYFDSEAEPVNFADGSKTVGVINDWIESKTNNKIKNILKTIEQDTQLLVVNAIYFKGLWDNPFDLQSTHKQKFFSTPTKMTEVDTMYDDGDYKYGELSDLDATCIELPYKDSAISMIIILPNKKDGLAELRNKLNNVDLKEISNSLNVRSVEVFIPRFRIEFDLSLKNVLTSMGMKTMFSDKANLSGLFESVIPIKVGDVQHKAFIDVNEAGSEAAAATVVKITLMSYTPEKPKFQADHPFMFFLKDHNSVYFAGQVVTI